MFILSHKKYGEYEDFEVNSESSPNTSYLVTVDHDEKTCYCTCPDFHYRKDNLKFGGAVTGFFIMIYSDKVRSIWRRF